MSLDSIKSQARHLAWKVDPNEGKNYNPFAKYAPPRRGGHGDEENQRLRHVQSEADAPSPLENERRNRQQTDFAPPHHAGTAPADGQLLQDGRKFDAPASQGKFDEEKELSDASASKDTEASRETTLVPNATQSSGEQQTHIVKKRNWARFGKKEEIQEDGPEPEEKKKWWKDTNPNITFMSMFRATVLGSWINVLLVCVPIGIALNYVKLEGSAKVSVFVVNFVAIIPLAALLSFATEELAMYVGETLGGLLNASFGNATELIVAIIALAQSKILIVQTSLIGSMLSNLLLVLGMCFFFGGVNRPKQHFNVTVAQTASSLLALSIGSLIIPTAFQRFGETTAGVAEISRGTAVILLVVYACYLLFQLKTHVDMYNEPSEKVEKRKRSKKEKGDTIRGIATMGAGSAASAGGQVNQSNLVRNPEDEEEEAPTLSRLGALITLLVATVLIALCSEFMVSGIDYITDAVSEEFVGLILLPIVGNAAGPYTPVFNTSFTSADNTQNTRPP